MNYKYIKTEEKNHVFTVTLNRPDVRNAFNAEMIQEITQCFIKVSTQASVKAVVLKGEGKAFCAGGDLNWMKEMVDYSYEQNIKDAQALYEMFEAVHSCSHPVISYVHGAAFGGALGLIACSDIVVAEDKTQFCFSEVKLGIAPAVISRFVLEKIPLAFVKEHMLTAKIFSCMEAFRMGLVQYCEDEDNFSARLDEVLDQVKECGPAAVSETKKMLNQLLHLNLSQQKDLVTKVIAERRVSAEGQEGLKSFLEKRSPSWRGSK